MKKREQKTQEPLTPTIEKKKYQFYRDKLNLNDAEGDSIHASDIGDLKEIIALEEIADMNR